MTETDEKIIEEFKRISKKGWIKTVQNSWSGVGITFESELNKESDTFMTPDYGDIEIKCSTKTSAFPFYLFSSAFDGPTFPELNRLIQNYGWTDYKDLDRKLLIIKANCCYVSSPNKNGYKFKFNIDYEKEVLTLQVYDRLGKMLDDLSYITFDTLKQHFDLKLKKLAFVLALRKQESKIDYFKYYQIRLYKSKGFDKFIELLAKGIIDISIIGRISKDESENSKKYRNKNIEFKICKNHIDKLFECYFDSDHDLS